jgi:hypothetical protein
MQVDYEQLVFTLEALVTPVSFVVYNATCISMQPANLITAASPCVHLQLENEELVFQLELKDNCICICGAG